MIETVEDVRTRSRLGRHLLILVVFFFIIVIVLVTVMMIVVFVLLIILILKVGVHLQVSLSKMTAIIIIVLLFIIVHIVVKKGTFVLVHDLSEDAQLLVSGVPCSICCCLTRLRIILILIIFIG